MYHLLVTSQEGAWDNGYYEFDRSRFLEYTNDDIANAFERLTPELKRKLQRWPCLFAYEGKNGLVRVGKITNIEERTRSLFIDFEFDKDFEPIPFEKLEPLASALDIRTWEMNRTHWAIKSSDLFKRLSAAKLGAKGAGKAKTPTSRLPKPPRAKHVVKSLQEFVQCVLELTPADGREVFFRGHSHRVKYKLEPALFRKDEYGNYLHFYDEHVLYRELLVSNSADFAGDTNTLDRLVRMQHYGLPTRLLDITSNPLIALYFACKSGLASARDGNVVPETQGEVILLSMERSRVKYFDSDTASCIANLARLPRHDKRAIDFALDRDGFNAQLPVERLLHFIREEKPYFLPRIEQADLRSIVCVKGKRTNNRITSQAGAFLLFGIDAVFEEAGDTAIAVERIAINDKARVLKELDLLNINDSTVFPNIENSARYIAQRFQFRPAPATTVADD